MNHMQSATLAFFLWVCALVCFLIATFRVSPEKPKLNLVALGLAFVAMARLVAGTALMLAILFFSGCATDTGDAAKDKRGRITNAVGEELFSVVLKFAVNEGSSYVSGQNGQDASEAAFGAASSLVNADTFRHIMQAAAGPAVAYVTAKEFKKADPQTPEEVAYVANTIGAALQTANNQLATK